MALHKFSPGGCRQDCETLNSCCPAGVCTSPNTQYRLTIYQDGVALGPILLNQQSQTSTLCEWHEGIANPGSICGGVAALGAQAIFTTSGGNTTLIVRVYNAAHPYSGATLLLSNDGSHLIVGTAPANCGQTLSDTFSVVNALCSGYTWTFDLEPVSTECSTTGTQAGSGGTCCPCQPCRLFRDYFDRSPGTDLGASWTEESGAWQIEAPSRLTTEDTGAIAICTATGSSAGVRATAKGAAGDKVRLILGWLDSDNYLFGEFMFGPSGTIAVGSVSGGSETIHETVSHEFPTNRFVSLFFCIDGDDVAKAQSSYGTGGNVGASVGAPPGTGTGLGTGDTNSGGIEFDAIDVYTISTGCEQCALPEEGPSCFTGGIGTISGKCCYLDPPTVEYEVDLGAGGLTNADCSACTTLAGIFIVRAGSTSYCEWSYTDNAFCPSGCGGAPGHWRLRITLSREVAPFCRWVVTVSLNDMTNLPCGMYSAVYSDAAALPSTACTGSFTLTKASESTLGGVAPCGGTLPATIGLASV